MDPATLPSPPRRCSFIVALAILTGLFSGTAESQPATPYAREVQQWRAERDAALRADDGWLTVVGLVWLEPGSNRLGSDPANDVPVPSPAAPPTIGTVEFDGSRALFRPSAGVDIRINGRVATEQVLRPQPGDYDVITTGTVTLFIIKRGSRYGVRMRDTNSQARRTFTGTEWFPIREEYRVTTRFVPHPRPTTVLVPNVLRDLDPWPSPGYVVFTLGGREVTLQAVYEGSNTDQLFFIFRDGTTGRETYPAGRFLYADPPKDGQVVLDFNKAHSPPCAFTPYATCPVPPKENALPVPVEAGERNPHR